MMSGYDCRNTRVFSFWWNDVSDEADRTSAGRLFQSREPAVANDRSPTVTYRDGRNMLDDRNRRLESDTNWHCIYLTDMLVTGHAVSTQKQLSYCRETALQGGSVSAKSGKGYSAFIYRSIFNHCDVIGLQSYRIRWNNAK